MEDNNDDLSDLPSALRRQITNHRLVRCFALRGLVRHQNRSFWNDVEEEMWSLLSLPGQVQPQLFKVMFEASVLRQLRRQAKINVLEANAHRITEHKKWAQMAEAEIRRNYHAELVSMKEDA